MRLARGLGRSPKWKLRAKAEKRHQTFNSLGRSPNKGAQGDGGERVPCGHLREAQSEP